jgi:hypothetical protein
LPNHTLHRQILQDSKDGGSVKLQLAGQYSQGRKAPTGFSGSGYFGKTLPRLPCKECGLSRHGDIMEKANLFAIKFMFANKNQPI